jgi:predicted kinase
MFIVLRGVGIPGCGKTTTLAQFAEGLGVVRVCRDEIREELTGSQADTTVNGGAWDIAMFFDVSLVNNYCFNYNL